MKPTRDQIRNATLALEELRMGSFQKDRKLLNMKVLKDRVRGDLVEGDVEPDGKSTVCRYNRCEWPLGEVMKFIER